MALAPICTLQLLQLEVRLEFAASRTVCHGEACRRMWQVTSYQGGHLDAPELHVHLEVLPD